MGNTLSVKVNKNIQIRLHRIIFEFSAYKVETKNFFLFISLYVFLKFLFFLCHHKLKSQLADQYLQRLQILVLKDKGRNMTKYTKDIACDIVGISQNLSGKLEKARFAYYRSLQQFPANGIGETVRKILASIDVSLKTVITSYFKR